MPDKTSPRISVRLPKPLLRDVQVRADSLGLDLGEHVRRLIAADLGQSAPDMPRGIKTVGVRRRRQLARKAGLAGAAARWGV